MTSRTRPDTRFGYGGPWLAAASALPLEGGLLQPRRLAALFAAAVLRPRLAVAFTVLLFRTRSEEVVLSTSLTGQALSAYFNERAFGVFPQNRLCRGLLVVPEHHSDYLRGRRRQALRTNLRRAEVAGIRCEAISDPRRAFDEIMEIVKHRRMSLTPAEPPILASWQAMLERPEMTLLVARGRLGRPLALTGAVIDDAVCVIRLAVASSHEARWALHDHLVRILIARGVKYVLGEGGGPFGALGFDANLLHYQHLLGYELRHLRPRTRRQLAPAGDSACPARDVRGGSGSFQLSPASPHVRERREPQSDPTWLGLAGRFERAIHAIRAADREEVRSPRR
jgi:hypothetical protein